MLNEDGMGQETVLDSPVVTIGRDPDNDVAVPWDPRVSRHHARLWLQGHTWILEDLNSTNGTYLGELRLHAPGMVTPGDTIRVGRTLLQLRADVATALRKPAEAEPEEPPAAERPGLWRRVLSSLGLVRRPSHPSVDGAQRPGDATVGAEPRDGAESRAQGWVSCTVSPDSMDIHACPPQQTAALTRDELRAALAGLSWQSHVVVKIVHALGADHAWVSLSTSAGHQGDLLILAGHTVERLRRAAGCDHVRVLPGATVPQETVRPLPAVD